MNASKYVWVWFYHIQTHWCFFWLPKANVWTDPDKIWHMDYKELGEQYKTCGYGFVIATPSGNKFGYQKLIEGLTRQKLVMWSPSDRVSNIDHIGVGQCV